MGEVVGGEAWGADSRRPNGAGPVSAPPRSTGSSPSSAWPPVLMRTPYGVSSLVTVAVAMVWSRSSLITPSLIYSRPLAAAGHAVLHAELRGQALAPRSLAAAGR